ncbi:MAG: class I SAM-dependent methyltransferase [Anaerolineae bacterium]
MGFGRTIALAWRGFYRWAAKRLYNEFAWAYDAVSWLVSAGHWSGWRKAVLAHVSGERVLEVGFGTGDLLVEMAARGWNACGLDLSPAMHRIVARKLRRRGLDAPHVRGVTQALPFADGSFDTLIATFPAEYIVAPETLREAARVLAPGGRFVIAGLVAQVEHPVLRRLVKPIYGDVRDGALAYFERVVTPAGFWVSVEVEPARWMRMPVVVLHKDAGCRMQEVGCKMQGQDR